MRPQTLFKALFSLSFHFIFATSLWGCYYYYHLLFTEKKGIRGSLSFPSPSISKGQSWDLTQTVGLWSQPTKPLLQLFLLLPCLPKRPSHNHCTKKKKKKSAPEKLQSSKKELRYCVLRLECHPPPYSFIEIIEIIDTQHCISLRYIA